MKLDLEPTRLRNAGVRRVVLAAGDQDESRGPMQELAARLERGGVRSRFVGLGPVAHSFPPDMPAIMCDAIAWVRGADPSTCRP